MPADDLNTNLFTKITWNGLTYFQTRFWNLPKFEYNKKKSIITRLFHYNVRKNTYFFLNNDSDTPELGRFFSVIKANNQCYLSYYPMSSIDASRGAVRYDFLERKVFNIENSSHLMVVPLQKYKKTAHVINLSTKTLLALT